MTTKAQKIALDNALVAPKNQRVIGKCNTRINPGMKPKESTYQVVLDALALTTCYPAFLITAEVPVIYMHHFWAIVDKHKASSIQDRQQELFYEQEALSFIRELGHSREIKYITDEDLAYQIDNNDSKKQDKMFYPRFTKIIIHHFLEKDKSISMRNIMFMHTARDVNLLGTMRFVSRHEDAQIYGAILPKGMTNQAMLDSVAYKTYYAIASGAEPPKSKKPKTKSDSTNSSEETPSKKKPTKAKKDVPSKKKKPASKPKPTKNKARVEADRGKGVPDEQQRKTSGADEGTGDSDDDESNDDNSDEVTKNDVESDANDDKEASDSEKTDSDEDKNMNLNSNDNEEEEKEKEDVRTPDSFEFNHDDEEYDELYKDVNMRLKLAEHEEVGKGDAEMTDITHESSKQSSSVSSDFASKFLNLDNVSPVIDGVASMMNVKTPHEELSTQAHPNLSVPVTAILKTSTVHVTTVTLIIQPFSSIPHITTPTPIPTTKPTTSLIPALPDFASLFGFDQRVSALEQDLSQSYTAEFEKKAQAEKEKYIDIIEKSVKEIIKDEFDLKKILLDKLEKSKPYRPVEQHRDLCDALVKSYQLDKDLFDSYGKTYSLKRGHEDKEKDEDPPADQTKGSKSQSKSSSKSAQAEEPVFETVDTKMPQDQGDDLGNTEDQSNVEEASKNDWFKKPERPPTPDRDWNAGNQINFRPPQTWINKMAKVEKPPTTFDELINTPIDFSAYVLGHLKIENLTQESVNDRLDLHNPEEHVYPFNLSKPLPLIEDQGRQVVPANYFFNNDLEYLKGGSSSGKYTTSTTKTNAAKYDNIEGIKDMLQMLWSPVKWYDYGYLEEIEVRKEDHKLYKFKEGDFPRLNLRDTEDVLLLLV
ncbi:hypothetical protein Tco_1165255 [Tanacetum coccineum]